MERPDYRDNLAALLEFNGGRHLMKPAKVAEYLGISARTVRRNYDIPAQGITCESMARKLCCESAGTY